MDVAKNSKLLVILFSECLFKAVFFWKIMLVVIYAEILHHSFIRQFTETLNRFFYLSRVNENLETYIPVWLE